MEQNKADNNRNNNNSDDNDDDDDDDDKNNVDNGDDNNGSIAVSTKRMSILDIPDGNTASSNNDDLYSTSGLTISSRSLSFPSPSATTASTMISINNYNNKKNKADIEKNVEIYNFMKSMFDGSSLKNIQQQQQQQRQGSLFHHSTVANVFIILSLLYLSFSCFCCMECLC